MTSAPAYDLEAARPTRQPLACAMPHLRTLLRDTVEDARHVVGIRDATGHLLWVEGDQAMRRAAARIGFLPGAVWRERGTDDGGWACTAAPIHDPDSGAALGAVDLAGPADGARQVTPTLARIVARAVEARLEAIYALRDAHALDLAHRSIDPSGRVTLISPTGRLLGRGLECRAVAPPTGPGRVRIGRSVLDAEPLREAPGYWLLRDRLDQEHASRSRTGAAAPRAREIALRLLGRSAAPLLLDGEAIDVSPRQLEICALLALHPDGLSTTSLRERLYGELDVADVTIRSELSRLRRLLGAAVAARPYRFAAAVGMDVERVEELLRAGRLAAAVQAYVGPVLPASEAPAIVELRDGLHQKLRATLLASDDADALSQWLGSPHGACDAAVARRLTLLASPSDPSYAAAVTIVERALGR